MGITDLEELVLRCRSPITRPHIDEAVGCYRAGAYRAAIVVTWLAVVHDLLGKLHELELAGDKRAAAVLKELAGLQSAGPQGIRKALEFERDTLLQKAETEFELLTPGERMDLERLKQDRDRCAHPSLDLAGAQFQPTAELARLHLRTAVDHVVSREPAQGIAALARIWADIGSSYFPTSSVDVEPVLRAGPLARARPTLIRSVLLGLSKSLLDGTEPPATRERQWAAISGTFKLHPVVCADVLKSELPRLVERVKADSWERVLMFLARVPSAWDLAPSDVRTKVGAFIRATKTPMGVAVAARFGLAFPEYAAVALTRFSEVAPNALAMLFKEGVDERARAAAIEESVRRLETSRSYDSAGAAGRSLVAPAAHLLDGAQLKRVLEAFLANEQVGPAWGIADELLPILLKASAPQLLVLRDVWRRVDERVHTDYYAELAAKLRDALVLAYPDFAAESWRSKKSASGPEAPADASE